jgi:hypothetical protein
MSIEDINYLKKNSIKQTYNFLIDSKDRDRLTYPNPNNYTVSFSTPFKNVTGIEVLDASIPRTMYSIDTNNNSLIYYIGNDNDSIIQNGLSNIEINNKIIPDTRLFNKFNMEIGDYTIQTLIPRFNDLMIINNIDLELTSLTNPPELKNKIKFTSTKPFILDMTNSTIAESLGFDLYTQPTENLNPEPSYKYFDKYNSNENFRKIYHSVYNEDEQKHRIVSPGIIYLLGNRYILLRCPEIEQHLFSSLSFSKYNLGLAKFRLNSYGYNDEKLELTKTPLREFHPIGKLPKMTLKFETAEGDLYDFKGVNHNILFSIYYYQPIGNNIFDKSILNPNYNADFINYLYTNDEQEELDKENDEEFSRDNIEIYKKKELEYNNNNSKDINNNKYNIIKKFSLDSSSSEEED